MARRSVLLGAMALGVTSVVAMAGSLYFLTATLSRPLPSPSPAPAATATLGNMPPSTTAPLASTVESPPSGIAPSVYYRDCDAVRRASAAPLYSGEPGYRLGLSPSAGVACR